MATVSDKPTEEPPRAGADLTIAIKCPACAMAGRVRIDQLPMVLRCAQCEQRFWIERNGKLKSERQSKKQTLQCPRCEQRESVPTDLTKSRFNCRRCDGVFHLTDDGRLIDRRDRQAQRVARRKPKLRDLPAPSRRKAMAIFGLSGMLFLCTVVWWTGFSSQSIESSVTHFTAACAIGDFETAKQSVVAGQQADFATWRARSYPEFSDPTYEAVVPKLSLLEEAQQGELTRVRIVLEHRGHRRQLQTQCWQETADGWRFAATRTLAMLQAAQQGD